MRLVSKKQYTLPKEAENLRVITQEGGKIKVSFEISEKNAENIQAIINGNIIEVSATLKEEVQDIKGTVDYIEKYFPIVRASTLSLDDEFLDYVPVTKRQEQLYNRLISAIKCGLSDFRAQRMDASLDAKNKICFHEGMNPAIGKSPEWWKKNAESFMSEKMSRLGTMKERTAYLGLLIKYLMKEKGYTASEAWRAVCDQSEELGNYVNTKDTNYCLETTGGRQISDWYDLANTYKIVFDKEIRSYSLVGGMYIDKGSDYPLANVISVNYPNNVYNASVGWIVISV